MKSYSNIGVERDNSARVRTLLVTKYIQLIYMKQFHPLLSYPQNN